jgi:hypothetical protein
VSSGGALEDGVSIAVSVVVSTASAARWLSHAWRRFILEGKNQGPRGVGV